MARRRGNFNWRLEIMYDGTNYSGWQTQPNAQSIQEIIESAIEKVIGEKIRLIGSGRTDAGVHAMGQTAHFHSEKELNCKTLWKALNGMLPKDIRVQECSSAPLDFHAQYSAIGKEYHYHICLLPLVPPFIRLFTSHIPYTLDIPLMKRAAKIFLGRHDFSSFANKASEGSAAKNPIRTLHRLDIIQTPEGLRLEFEGDGFLYKMVRNITGLLIEIAKGKRSIDEIETLFKAKDRRLAPKSADAKGLFLMKVYYPDSIL